MSLGARLSGWTLRALGVLMVASAVSVAAFKAPDRPLESLVARWAPPPSQFIELPLPSGTQLTHLRDEGPRTDPLPILLLHGTSDSLHTWDGWAKDLSKTRRVLRVDLPGFGLTGPAPSGDYGTRQYVAFVQALLDQQQLRRVVIVGNSLGGEVAWMTAAAHPDRVAGLVLLDPAGLPFEPDALPLGFQLSATTVGSWMGRHLLPRPLVRHSVESVFGRPERVPQAEVDRFFEMSVRAGNREALHLRIQALLAERAQGLAVPEWPKVMAPTLLVWGERDRLIPPSTAQQYLQQRAPQAPPAQLVVLPGLGHVPQLEDPATSLAAVRPFLDGLR
ncbi:MAG: alpha/beta fold hydrolase [Inhella sp.]|uniref:alpha/beta fold hydrolase n=1 Tax=Inhella sp. TaxID=1921806 RepID=UPI00391EE1FC